MNRGEVIAGVVLAGLGVFIVSEATGWDYIGSDGPGPGFFPLWYGIAMAVLAVLLVVQNVVARTEAAERSAVNWRQVGRVLFTWSGFVVSVALLKPLGFVASFGLFTLFVVRGLYGRPWRSAVSVAVGCAAGFYLVFPFALNVRLPVGFLGF